jgi:hypothetical protein
MRRRTPDRFISSVVAQAVGVPYVIIIISFVESRFGVYGIERESQNACN